MSSQHDVLMARHHERIRRFVERGLRIEDHSFIREHTHQLVGWAHGKVDITRHEDGSLSVMIEEPDVEAMESMTARIRPLILHEERANLTNVLEAIGYLIRGLSVDDDLKRGHRALSRDWKTRRPERGRRLAYEIWAENQGSITDVDLALGWLYADLVHQDVDAHQHALAFGYQHRYQAAVLIMCNVAYHAKATMNLIRGLALRGLIHMDIPPQPPIPPREK